jgi:hypothetical protein
MVIRDTAALFTATQGLVPGAHGAADRKFRRMI